MLFMYKLPFMRACLGLESALNHFSVPLHHNPQIQEGTVKAYEPGALAQAKAVVAIFPAGDMKSIWDANGSFFGLNDRSVNEVYIGGSPQAYPRAYATVDVANHITRNSSPTFLAAGENDHFFVLRPGSIGGQIVFQGVGQFLETYAK
jgi:hypothetical protein